jgi:hypothetical protein
VVTLREKGRDARENRTRAKNVMGKDKGEAWGLRWASKRWMRTEAGNWASDVGTTEKRNR